MLNLILNQPDILFVVVIFFLLLCLVFATVQQIVRNA